MKKQIKFRWERVDTGKLAICYLTPIEIVGNRLYKQSDINAILRKN